MSKYTLLGLFMQALLCNLLLASNSLAQKSMEEIYVDLAFNNSDLKEVFEEIEANTKFKFHYKKDFVKSKKLYTANFNNASLADVLRYISKKENLKFKRINGDISVRKNVFTIDASFEETFSFQQQTVSGTVTSEDDGEPLPGVSILIKGTSNGTTTDINGKFAISASSNDVLQFSYIGYLTQEVEAGNQTQLNIKLETDLEQLEEVVVIGYGSVKKSDLTGAVGSAKGKDLTAFPAANLGQALEGRIAGVQVSSTNGEPGSNPKITIRGITSPFSGSNPLFVVDGFVGGIVPPPEDIESIEVLKDASAAAIYGSRGSNGVVIISTKSGKKGKPVVELNTSFSSQEVIKKLDMLNRAEYEDLMLEIDPNYSLIPDKSVDTNWQDEIFRTGVLKNTQVSVSGGSDNVKYFVSGTYFDQEGIVIGSDFNRISFNSNIDFKVNKRLNISANVLGRRTKSNGIISQERTGGVVFQGAISSAYLFAPDLGIYNEDGSYTVARSGDAFNNPVAIASARTDERVNDNLQLNLRADLEIFDWMRFTATFGNRVSNRNQGKYTPSSLVAGAPGGVASISSGRNTDMLSENYFTFHNTFGDLHDVKLITGMSYQDQVFTGFNTGNENFISDNFLYWNLGNGTLIQLPGSGYSRSELLSYYGRAEYGFDSRYLVTATLRYDGSSRLSEGNKYELFPSIGVAWNVGNEAFMSGFNNLNMFKIRASLGTTGNQNIGIYSTLPTLGTKVYSDDNNNIVTALVPGQIPNSDLTWETSKQLNFGTDLEFWNGKLTFSADVYKTNTTNLLFSVPLNPIVGGNAKQNRNLGEIENRGLEISLGTNQQFNELIWNANLNFSMNRNKVISLPEGEDIFYTTVPDHINGLSGSTQSQVLREGEPIGVFWGFYYDGVYQEGDNFIEGSGFEKQAGGEKFRDIAGGRDEENQIIYEPDGKLNSNDRTIIGDPNPDFIFGFNNSLAYKGFDFNLFLTGAVGGEMINFTRMELEMLNAGTNATRNAALNRWTPSNTNTDVPRASINGRQARISTRFIEDASYVRLKNISLGYSLPTSPLSKVGIRKVRFYISAQNLFTITNYQGVDPEVSYRNSSQNLGLDYGSYPNTKGYTAGLNLSF